jgi:hypothetical protein
MTMESYFSILLEKTGAKELILLSDHASLQRHYQRREKTSIERQPALRTMSLGPPNCPLRKASRDNLNDLVKGKKKGSSRKKAILDDFFDEVAPGLHSRQKTKNKMATVPRSTITEKSSESRTSFKNTRSFLRRDGLRVTKSRDAMLHLGIYGRVHTQKIEKELTKKDLKEFLEEVEDIVSQRVPRRAMSAREARWSARPAFETKQRSDSQLYTSTHARSNSIFV